MFAGKKQPRQDIPLQSARRREQESTKMPDRDPAQRSSPAVHKPVLLREVVHHLDLQPGLTVVDGTVGAAGHSRRILEVIGPTGTLIGLDRDPMMLGLAAQVLSAPNVHLIHFSYADLPEALQSLNVDSVDRILLDLGLSSDQLVDRERGFGFQTGGPLDMRFDTSRGQPAWQLMENADAEELARIFQGYGEERFSGAIAAEIVARRKRSPVRTAADLVEAVERAVPGKSRQESHKHPATRVFQALRIAVNEELSHLQRALEHSLYDSLKTGGRLVVITFHSLEDRLVKDAFRNEERWQNLTPKPVPATPLEQKINPRSRTAKLRAARKR